MEKVASIIKYKDKNKAIIWIFTLPIKYSSYEAKTILDDVRQGNYLLWTEQGGIKIL